MTWRECIGSARGRLTIVFCLAVVLSMVLFMPYYYQEIIGPKVGILLNDPVLNFFTPVDWSNAVFFILTVALIQTLTLYYGNAEVFLTGLMSFCVVNILRVISMYVITLEPPADMILLIDPISASLVYPEQAFAKDLFFSGHVSSMMILVYIERSRVWYLIKIAATVLMALFLAWQHVHYSVDLVVAPLATYAVFLGVRRFIRSIPAPKPISGEKTGIIGLNEHLK